MAEENEDGQEKTEEPTEKRLTESREKGQVARSRELATAAVFGGGMLAVLSMGGWMAQAAGEWMRSALTFAPSLVAGAGRDLAPRFGELLSALLLVVMPVIAVCFIAAFIAPAIMGGFQFSADAIAPKPNRLDPLAGLKRIYGRDGLVELLKSLLRILFVSGFAIAGIVFAASHLMALMHTPLVNAVADGFGMVLHTLLLMVFGLVLLALLDAPYQRWSHRQKLMMTRQELREELKETEGRPEIKSRIRQLQHQMSQRRMMDDVPKADVILVNPTHYAVALKYDAKRMRAPVLVAKGVDEIARIIRESAERHGVPIVSSPPLARALYGQVEIGREIPVNLYAAVAQMLGYVYQLRTWRRRGGSVPVVPAVDVPGAEH